MRATPQNALSAWETGGHESRAKMHYFERQFQRTAVKVLPGEYYTTDDDLALVTVLGSCVSACLRDADAGVGGMNHFMLPASGTKGVVGESARYGSYAMELLVNELLKRGARRNYIEAKVFGGGAVLAGFTSTHVGARNVQFVREYLTAEGIPIVAEDLGDVYARKLCFLPLSGQAFMRRIDSSYATADLDSESEYGKRLVAKPVSGEIELFN